MNYKKQLILSLQYEPELWTIVTTDKDGHFIIRNNDIEIYLNTDIKGRFCKFYIIYKEWTLYSITVNDLFKTLFNKLGPYFVHLLIHHEEPETAESVNKLLPWWKRVRQPDSNMNIDILSVNLKAELAKQGKYKFTMNELKDVEPNDIIQFRKNGWIDDK